MPVKELMDLAHHSCWHQSYITSAILPKTKTSITLSIINGPKQDLIKAINTKPHTRCIKGFNKARLSFPFHSFHQMYFSGTHKDKTTKFPKKAPGIRQNHYLTSVSSMSQIMCIEIPASVCVWEWIGLNSDLSSLYWDSHHELPLLNHHTALMPGRKFLLTPTNHTPKEVRLNLDAASDSWFSTNSKRLWFWHEWACEGGVGHRSWASICCSFPLLVKTILCRL